MPKLNLSGLHVVVTGASSGIGEAVARELARAGARLSLVARRKERLEALAAEARNLGAPSASVFPADLSRAGTAGPLGTGIEQAAGPVDILVNNAGISGGVSTFADANPKDLRDAIEVNFAAPVELARAVLPGMISRRKGVIVSVSSGFAFVAVPGSAIYCATKRALSMLDDVLRAETHGTGVGILSVYPGPVDTDMLRGTAKALGSEGLPPVPTGTPAELARKLREALEKGRDSLHYPAVYGVAPLLGPAAGPVLRRLGPQAVKILKRN